MTMVKTDLVIEKRYLQQFKDLCVRLEPENLTCDGELSRSESDRKYKKLMKDWKRLEKKVGRSVSEQEIWELMYPHVYSSDNIVNLSELLTEQVMRGG